MQSDQKNSQQQGHAIDLDGLAWINDFGWLRPAELAWLLWPGSPLREKNAQRIVRRWVRDGLVLARPLPGKNGRALVLATAGVRLLSEAGLQGSSGKDIGQMVDGRWIPPATWRHDLMAAGVLVRLRARGYEVVPERRLRIIDEDLEKVPDGLAYWPDQPNAAAIWIEVENSKKTGQHLQHLARQAIRIVRGDGPTLMQSTIKPTQVVFAVPPPTRDRQGYLRDHERTVKEAIAQYLKTPATFMFLRLALKEDGVSGWQGETVEIRRT